MTATTTTEQTVTTPPPVIESAAKPVAPKPASKAVGRKSSLIPKALTKPMVKAPAKAPAKVVAKPAAKPAAEKQAKLKKPKLVRDSFTIPKAEYLVLDTLKERALKLSREVKKSELLRAGIKALAALSDTALLAALSAVPTIKTGRPVADKPAAQDKPAKKVRSTKR